MTHSIRTATAADAKAVTRLWTEAYVTTEPGGRTEPYTERDYLAATAAGSVFVAEGEGRSGGAGEGEVAGVVVLYPPGAAGRAIGRDGEAELSRLVVAPQARRVGLGASLVDLCAERAGSAGAEAVVLWSRPWQTDAHRLYEARGYRRVRERDEVEEGGGERLVFRLALAQGG